MANHFHLMHIGKNFGQFLSDDFLCDTVLVTRNGELKAHSLILAAVSSVFRAAFESSDGGPGMRHLSLPDVDIETLEIALGFMYTGALNRLPEIYRESDKLQGLLMILKDLGLDEDKVSRCEITFARYRRIFFWFNLSLSEIFF